MAERIQRKRTKGWKMPPNTVSVTRPGKFGNPFDFRSGDCSFLALTYGCRGDRAGRIEASVKAFREWIEPQPKGKKLVRYERGVSFGNDEKTFQVGPRFIVGPPPSSKSIQDLRGKNLACFCALDQPCHVDVLIELANAPQAKASVAPPPHPGASSQHEETGLVNKAAGKNIRT